MVIISVSAGVQTNQEVMEQRGGAMGGGQYLEVLNPQEIDEQRDEIIDRPDLLPQSAKSLNPPPEVNVEHLGQPERHRSSHATNS